MAKTTHTSVTRMSMGHSSSAYSLDWVIPSGKVTAAKTMMSCQPQKWILVSASLAMRVLSRRCDE